MIMTLKTTAKTTHKTVLMTVTNDTNDEDNYDYDGYSYVDLRITVHPILNRFTVIRQTTETVNVCECLDDSITISLSKTAHTVLHKTVRCGASTGCF